MRLVLAPAAFASDGCSASGLVLAILLYFEAHAEQPPQPRRDYGMSLRLCQLPQPAELPSNHKETAANTLHAKRSSSKGVYASVLGAALLTAHVPGSTEVRAIQ